MLKRPCEEKTMKTDEELGYLPREVYLERQESLQNAVNPKPYTKEESDRIKEEKRKQINL